MTNQEAVEILKELWRSEHTDKYSEKEIRCSLDLAINTLENQIKESSLCCTKAKDKTILEYLDDIEDIVINSFKANHKFEDEPFIEEEYDILNALSDARAAVKFRIAKKPVDIHKIRDLIVVGKCPTCSEGANDEMKACASCGQLLDWSGE